MWSAWSVDFLAEASFESEVARMKRGDPDALEAALSRYQNRLYRYLLRLSGDTALADDLFQQTWLKVLTRLHRYDASRPFAPWLFKVARNVALDHLRKSSPESLDESHRPEPASPRPSAYDDVLARERKSQLEQRLERLPLVYREALTLRFEEELDFEAIARVQDCPLSTAKSRVRRGLQMLRHEMRGREGELG